MNRRTFLCKTLTFLAAAYVSDAWRCFSAEAASPAPLQCPKIKETYLKFVLPLQNRLQTDLIVLHHIGDSNEDFSAADVHQWHINNGWAGIGYHFVIRKNGVIERGRPLDTVGAHCYGYNEHSVGINVVGNFEMAFPTEAQLDSAVQLTAYLCQLYRIDPFADGVVLGHRDLNATLCPGKNFYAELDAFRQRVRSNFSRTLVRRAPSSRRHRLPDVH